MAKMNSAFELNQADRSYNEFKNFAENIRVSLRISCEDCFGLCCIALHFSRSEGFPENKKAGKPCSNLLADFRCAVHDSLMKNGLKGCLAFDCFGAGQKTSQISFSGRNWKDYAEDAEKLFSIFNIQRQLNEMLWYLTDPVMFKSEMKMESISKELIEETLNFSALPVEDLLKLNVEAHRFKVNGVLLQLSESVRKEYPEVKKCLHKGKKNGRGIDLISADLRKMTLEGMNLRGACLIAANLSGVALRGVDLIGADLRDADISGADLTQTLFLTQAQVNVSKGDLHTKLPVGIERPFYWHLTK